MAGRFFGVGAERDAVDAAPRAQIARQQMARSRFI